jgi:signal transduction histidine kinase
MNIVGSVREQRAVRALVRFSELLSGIVEPAPVMRSLVEAALETANAAAAVVVEIGTDGSTRIGAAANLPAQLDGFPPEDALEPALGDILLQACGSEVCRDAQTIVAPLASGGGLYGSIVYVYPKSRVLDDYDHSLAHALAGLAASGLNSAARYAELARNYAELRAQREAMVGNEKLRALGEMAAGVSHDLKNIINPLSLHLQFLRRAIPKTDEESQQSIVEMQGILKRGLETIERLRDYSRQAPGGRAELCDLRDLARESIEISKPRTRTKHDVHFTIVTLLEEPPTVKLSAGEAIAAIVNLIVNAIDAMETGGKIEISTGRTPEGEGFLRVTDNGPGIKDDVRPKVFDPFFTTKGKAGTGLGLSTVFSFVQRHHGRITVESADGEGATFTMVFPAAAG